MYLSSSQLMTFCCLHILWGEKAHLRPLVFVFPYSVGKPKVCGFLMQALLFRAYRKVG